MIPTSYNKVERITEGDRKVLTLRVYGVEKNLFLKRKESTLLRPGREDVNLFPKRLRGFSGLRGSSLKCWSFKGLLKWPKDSVGPVKTLFECILEFPVERHLLVLQTKVKGDPNRIREGRPEGRGVWGRKRLTEHDEECWEEFEAEKNLREERRGSVDTEVVVV